MSEQLLCCKEDPVGRLVRGIMIQGPLAARLYLVGGGIVQVDICVIAACFKLRAGRPVVPAVIDRRQLYAVCDLIDRRQTDIAALVQALVACTG